MGNIRKTGLALLLAVSCLNLQAAAYAAQDVREAEGGQLIGVSEAKIEQVYMNMPEVHVYAKGLAREEVEAARAYVAQEELALESCETFAQSGEGICYYVLLDISGSIPGTYFNAFKDSIQAFQDGLGEKDELVLCAFGDEVSLAADGSQTSEEMQTILEGLKNNNQETLLFEAIDRIADLAYQNSRFSRRILAVMSDGEDFATGKVQSQEALKKLNDMGIPVYAFCISGTAKENINSFGEFARTSGGNIRIFSPEEGEGLLNELSAELGQDLSIEYKASTNMVSNAEDTFTLKLKDGRNLAYTILNNRWIPDTVAPYVIEASAVGDRQIRLVFNEPLLGTETPANYQLSCDEENIGISSVSYEDGDNAVLNLFLSEPAHSGNYRLQCNNITDASMEKNPLANSPEAQIEGDDARSGTAVVVFDIIDIDPPTEPSKEQALKGESRDYTGVFFLIFAAIAVLVVVVVVVAVGKKKPKSPNEARDPQKEPASGSPAPSQVLMEDEDFKQHVAMAVPGKILQVTLGRPGMQARQTTWKIGKSLFVGRSSICDIAIDDSTLSSQHFCLENENGDIYITDLDSTNGTSVNGIRINNKRRIESGSVIEAGSMKIVIRW